MEHPGISYTSLQGVFLLQFHLFKTLFCSLACSPQRFNEPDPFMKIGGHLAIERTMAVTVESSMTHVFLKCAQ